MIIHCKSIFGNPTNAENPTFRGCRVFDQKGYGCGVESKTTSASRKKSEILSQKNTLGCFAHKAHANEHDFSVLVRCDLRVVDSLLIAYSAHKNFHCFSPLH